MNRLFISHSWAYSAHYDKVEEFLQKENVEYYNHSEPKDEPIYTDGTDNQLREKIDAKIRGYSCVIILAGVYVSYSKMINIELAQKYNKPIIAVQLWGAECTSTVVKKAADTIVGWNSKSISDEVMEYAICQ